MEYSDSLAAELITRFNLDPKTQKVWKTRNKIPDKYANPDYKSPSEPDKAELIIQKRILEVLKYDFVNGSLLCDLAGVPRQKWNDVTRGKTSSFASHEITALKKEINRLRLEIAKAFERRSEPALLQLLKNEILLLRPIIQSGGGTMIDYDRASRFKRGEYSLNSEDYQVIKDAYVKIAIQLSI